MLESLYYDVNISYYSCLFNHLFPVLLLSITYAEHINSVKVAKIVLSLF
jgi:hypothetical protein